jgi:hypothetical protein
VDLQGANFLINCTLLNSNSNYLLKLAKTDFDTNETVKLGCGCVEDSLECSREKEEKRLQQSRKILSMVTGLFHSNIHEIHPFQLNKPNYGCNL